MADLNKLYSVIPKKPSTWNIADVGKWLEFIELPSYKSDFEKSSIDGSVLFDIRIDTLDEFLEKIENPIKRKFHRLKILQWLQKHLINYENEFLNAKIENELSKEKENEKIILIKSCEEDKNAKIFKFSSKFSNISNTGETSKEKK